MSTDITRAGAIIGTYTGVTLPGTKYPSNFADIVDFIQTLPGFEGATWTAWPACRKASEAHFRAVLEAAGEPVTPWLYNAEPDPASVVALFERIKAVHS